jgi:hypothetical protein
MFAPVDTFLDVLDDSQAAANGYMVGFDHPVSARFAFLDSRWDSGKFEAGLRTGAASSVSIMPR